MKTLLALALGLVSLCSVSIAPALAQPIIHIGVSVPLTGPAASAGAAMRDGILLAREELHPESSVEFVFEDNQMTGNGGLTSLRALRNQQGVQAMMVFGGPSILAMRQSIEAEKIPTIALSAAKQLDVGGNGSITRIWESTSGLGSLFAKLTHELRSKNVAIISMENDVGIGIRDLFLASHSGTLVLNELLQSSDQDFSSLVSRIKSAKADIIFVNLLAGQATTLLRRLREQNISATIVFHSGVFFDPTARTPYPRDFEGTYIATVDDSKAADFYAALVAKGKRGSAVYMAAIAYDAARVIAKAVKQGWDGTSLPIPAESVDGVLGHYSSVATTSWEPSMRIIKIKNSRSEEVRF